MSVPVLVVGDPVGEADGIPEPDAPEPDAPEPGAVDGDPLSH